MKEVSKILLLVFLLILAGLKTYAQIGGNLSPLKYSIHTYSILMDDEAYVTIWNIYPAGTTQLDLENHTAVPLVKGVAYTDLNIDPAKSGGRAYFKVQFDGNMSIYNGTPGSGDYVLGYMETTVDGNACLTARIQPFTLYAPFDVDIALEATEITPKCADESGRLHRPGENTFQTEVLYQVNVEYPDETLLGYVGLLTWSFEFEVKVAGEGGGTSGTIASIRADGGALPINYAVVPGTSIFNGSCTVDPSDSDPLTFTIVYNDVLGVNQNITVTISSIQGAYFEQDIDELNSTQTGNNIILNTLHCMPNVGHIEAWN